MCFLGVSKWPDHHDSPRRVLHEALVGDDERLGQLDVRVVVGGLPLRLEVLVHPLPVLVERPRGQEGLTAQITGDRVLMGLHVGLVRGLAVESLPTLQTQRLVPVTDVLVDLEVGQQRALHGESSGTMVTFEGFLLGVYSDVSHKIARFLEFSAKYMLLILYYRQFSSQLHMNPNLEQKLQM